MKGHTFFSIFLLCSLLIAAWPASLRAGDEQASSIQLDFFWTQHCPHCRKARPFIARLTESYPWLEVNSYPLDNNPGNVRLFLNKAGRLGMPANSVPAFIFCGQMLVGFADAETTGKQIERKLLDCRRSPANLNSKPAADRETVDLPLLGHIAATDFSLPAFTLIIAALDAFNPCAFFVLLFLLSLLIHSHNRLQILVIGGTFVFFSGLMYFLFMAAWLNLFLLMEQIAMITALAGIIAIVMGLLNIKDYFFFRQGPSLSIPDSARPGLYQRMRDLALTGSWPAKITAAIVLAIVVNSYDLLCTAGLPMVYTRVLTLHELGTMQYYLFLAAYNVIYVIPLALIVVLFSITLSCKKLSERQGRLLKLLSGTMMLGLGSILLLSPERLNNLWVSVSVIAFAACLTLVFAFVDQQRNAGER